MKRNGFSLIELMVVVAIIAILSSIIVPQYGQYVQRGNRSDAIGSLQGIMDAQERFYTDRITYTTDLTQIGLANPYITPRGDYSIAARQCTQGGVNLPLSQCVELVATSLGGQVADGNLITNTLGRQDRILPDNTIAKW